MLGDPGVGPNRSHWSRGAEIPTDSGGRNSGTLALEYVGSRRQHLARNLNRTAEGEHGLLVKVIGSGALDDSAQQSEADKKHNSLFHLILFLSSPFSDHLESSSIVIIKL